MSDGVPPVEPREPPAPRPGVGTGWLAFGALALLLIGAVAGGTLGGRPRPAAETSPGFAVIRGGQEAAADFTLSRLDGRPASLHEFRGRVVLLNFWATWCAPCREEIPAMEVLARDLQARGLVVLAVNFDENPETVRAFAHETGLALPVLLDRDGSVARRYRVTGLPTSIFVDRRGVVTGTVIGFRDWASPAARRYVGGLVSIDEA